jgi:hypothetical protein
MPANTSIIIPIFFGFILNYFEGQSCSVSRSAAITKEGIELPALGDETLLKKAIHHDGINSNDENYWRWNCNREHYLNTPANFV